jgi:hypothetical protein
MKSGLQNFACLRTLLSGIILAFALNRVSLRCNHETGVKQEVLMNRRNCPFLLAFIFFVLISFSFSLAAQEIPDYGKIVGTWKIEVDADGEYYYLTLELKNAEENLEGTISENMGSFTDVPISEIVFDGESLDFEFISPTPPDGLEKSVKADFKVGVDTMDGVMSVPDLEASATATATREKL